MDIVAKLERACGGDLDAIPDVQGEGLDATDAVEVYLLGALLRKARIILLAERAFRRMPRSRQEEWRERLCDRVLLVHYHIKVSRVGQNGEDAVIVGNKFGQSALGSVEWVRKNRKSIRRRFRVKAPRGRRRLRLDADEAEAEAF